MLKLERITKIYADQGTETFFQALAGIDLEVQQGEFITIVGPSGAGKSTLLNILGANIKPTSGSYYVKGKNLLTLSKNMIRNYRKNVCGFLWQESEQNLILDLTVEQNLLQVLRIGKYKGNRDERIEEILTKLEMSHRKYHEVRRLSGGEALRISLAMAVINEPELLIADEPVAELDTKTALKVIHFLKSLNELGMTIIVSTHNKLFNRVADRIYQLSNGIIGGMIPSTHPDKQFLSVNSLGQVQIPLDAREDEEIKFVEFVQDSDAFRLVPFRFDRNI